MEDASIYEVELGDGNSLFAVFDGHGGKRLSIQATRSASSCKANSSTFSSISAPTNRATTNRH